MPFLIRSRNAGSRTAASGTTIDFVNGSYMVNGVVVTAADVVSDTSRISASGLSILPSGDGIVSFLGTFRDILWTANWTAVLELDLLEPEASPPEHQNTLLYIGNSGGTRYIIVKTTAAKPVFDEWDGVTERKLLPTTEHGVGISRIAVTRTADLAAISMNGDAATSDASSMVDIEYAVADAAWHNKSSPAGYIRSIEITDPVAASELPALSTVS